jgi:diguanylate cyclase (GGDEF)-like protein
MVTGIFTGRSLPVFLRNFRIFLLILLWLPLLGGFAQAAPNTPPVAQEGLLDLSSVNLDQEVISLDGQWAFYWNQLLEPGKTDQGSLSAYVDFPSSWDKYVINGEAIPGHGYATYRLTFIAPEKRIMALKIPKVRTAYKLYVNGSLVAFAGQVGTDRNAMDPQYLPQAASFEAQPGENELVIQVSNFYQPSGGLLYSIQLGSEQQILGHRDHNIAYELFLFGALFMMGIYHLSLFLFRKKDRGSLYFGVFCTIVAIRTLLIGEAYLYYLLPGLDFEIARKIQTLTYYLGTPLIIMFFKAILPGYFNDRIVKITQFIALIYGGIVVMTPSYVYTAINPFYQIWSILLILYLVVAITRIALRREPDSLLIVLGGLALITTCLIDILTLTGWINDSWPTFLINLCQSDSNSSTGQFIFATLYSILLAKHFSQSLEDKITLSNKLSILNNHLDDLVVERTRALMESNQKIEEQNQELAKINLELQRLSLNDPLTGLWNRRKYNQTIELEWLRCLKNQKPISLLFIDVDYFKKFNDQYGHVAGDDCLIRIANALRSSLMRSSDMVVRYGGEEFVVLLPETEKEYATKIAYRIQKNVDALNILHEQSLVKNHVTVSIGISSMIPDSNSSHEQLIKTADGALYHAKSAGRYQIKTAIEPSY